MLFYLTDNPSGPVPFLSLVIKLDYLNLYAARWGQPAGRCR